KSGLYSELRKAVHSIEEMAEASQAYDVLYHMLMLRRHEKDFMLRLDPVYVQRFNEGIEPLRSALILNQQKNDTTQAEALLEQYNNRFLQLVNAQQEMGLLSSSFDRLITTLRETVAQVQAGATAVASASEEMSAITK